MNMWSIKYLLVLLFLNVTMLVYSQNSTSISQDTVKENGIYLEKTKKVSKYDLRQHWYRKYWSTLIPTQAVIQYAGNMALISTGIGWDYGSRREWETHAMFGFLPKYQSRRNKLTFTLKENFIPWSVYLGKGFAFEPLSTGLYLNSIIGHEFWAHQPVRYNSGYYTFSTKIHLNIFVGERITKRISPNRRLLVKSVTGFYEISSPDLYIFTKIKNKSLSLYDIICLSVGVKFQIL